MKIKYLGIILIAVILVFAFIYCGISSSKGKVDVPTNSLALVLSSTKYEVNDYICDYEVFKRYKDDNK